MVAMHKTTKPLIFVGFHSCRAILPFDQTYYTPRQTVTLPDNGDISFANEKYNECHNRKGGNYNISRLQDAEEQQ